MADFTMYLRDAIKFSGGTISYPGPVAKMTGGDIGLNDYTIFDIDPSNPTHKDHLNGLIIDHYFMREIGAETLEQFRLFMRRRMNEIMPYYNKLYESETIDYQALSSINLHTTNTGELTEEETGEVSTDAANTGHGTSRATNFELPQTALSGNADYASSGSDSVSDNNTTQTGSSNTTQNTTNTTNGDTETTGFQGVAADLVMRYRDSLLNIDLMVVAQLEDLFMLVWHTGDTYTQGVLF